MSRPCQRSFSRNAIKPATRFAVKGPRKVSHRQRKCRCETSNFDSIEEYCTPAQRMSYWRETLNLRFIGQPRDPTEWNTRAQLAQRVPHPGRDVHLCVFRRFSTRKDPMDLPAEQAAMGAPSCFCGWSKSFRPRHAPLNAHTSHLCAVS